VCTFLWLLGSRFALVWLSPVPRETEAGRQMALWACRWRPTWPACSSACCCRCPELGITAQVLPSLRLEGERLWVEKPQTVIASGSSTSRSMAWSKWKWGAPL
jgi:hypothetical protein